MKVIAAKGILLNESGNILLLKRSSADVLDSNKWDLPGGRIKQKENLLVGLAREILEETGLQIIRPKLWSRWKYKPDRNITITGFTFICCEYKGEITLSSEHSNYNWFSAREVDTLEIHENLKKEIKTLLSGNGKVSLWNRFWHFKLSLNNF